MMFTGQLGTLASQPGNFVLGFPFAGTIRSTPVATLSIQSSSTFATPDGGTESVGPINVVGTIIPQRTYLTLASGNNTFAVPTGAVGVVIVPPSNGAIVLKYKTVSGDTGIIIPQQNPSVFMFDSTTPPTSIIINAASLNTGVTAVLFF